MALKGFKKAVSIVVFGAGDPRGGGQAGAAPIRSCKCPLGAGIGLRPIEKNHWHKRIEPSDVITMWGRRLWSAEIVPSISTPTCTSSSRKFARSVFEVFEAGRELHIREGLPEVDVGLAGS